MATRVFSDKSIVFDNTGATYKVKKIVDASTGYKIDVAKYVAYSPVSSNPSPGIGLSLLTLTRCHKVYMPITYALNMFGLSFATLSSLLVWCFLEHRHVMADAARRIPQVIMESIPGRVKAANKDETGEPEVPMWWYLVSCALALFMSIFAVEYWDAELKWYGVLLSCVVALVFYPGVGQIGGLLRLDCCADVCPSWLWSMPLPT